MSIGQPWRAIVATLLCIPFVAQANGPRLPMEPSVPSPVDSTNDNTPHEAFPLIVSPRQEPLIFRSEATNSQKEQEWRDLKTKILSDFSGRMASDFKVPSGLRERTYFWFDIYTRFGESHHIIHHVRFPWIVYKVVDTTEMLLNGKGPLWLRRDRGEKLAKKEAEEIRHALRRLASRKTYDHLPPLEKDLFDKLLPVKGSRRTVFRNAADSVRNQLGQKDFFQRGLINSSRYLPYMEEEFRKFGLPSELTRMPFVESSFNEDARSKVGASGIWQIMPRTGQAYMMVNDVIDERNSPLKATSAAARLLRSYHRAMNSWSLAITSYNHGIGNIHKAINHANSRDLATIIERYHDGDFRFASSNFFTCFLAALYAERYHELIFKDIPREPLQETEMVRLNGATRASYLAKITGLDRETILRYNLDLRNAIKKNASLPRGYTLHLPPGYKDRLTRQIGVQEKQPRRPRT
jgi:membrane-bound lytic murein transglycosylase D